MSRFEALIVDFGGVLTTPLQDSMIQFAAASGIELQDLVRAALGAYAGEDDTLVTAFETGGIPEDEFAREFATRLSTSTGVTIEAEGLVNRLFGTLRLEEDMLKLVEDARGAGYKTGLLSNSWGVDRYPQQRLQPLFDTIVISGEVGMRKPDPPIFTHTLEALGVEASAAVFVDDHPGHLKTAQELGMTTVLHRDPVSSIKEVRALLDLP